MLARHQNELYLRLEAAQATGCVIITRWELLIWHEKTRFSKTIWRSIAEKWMEIGDGTPLFVGIIGNIKEESARLTFIYGKGLTDSSESWFKNIETYLGKNDEADE